MRKNFAIILIVTAFAFLTSNYADGEGKQKYVDKQSNTMSGNSENHASVNAANKKQSIADKYFSPTVGIPKQPMLSPNANGLFCDSDNTGTITIYSTNGSAQSEIDVKLDGQSIGSLKTYYPNGEPRCKSPTSKGIITISVPAGKHILNANSPNVRWPNHSFSVERCGCMVLPLS